jgi:hypothetical protein
MKKTLIVIVVLLAAVFAFSQTAAAPSTVEYKVGDQGPAGGWVFFDKGLYLDGWRYLEAAPADFPGVWQWGAVEVNETNTDLGSGKKNTTALLAALTKASQTGKAAQLCDAYSNGGYDDWFLPSRDELNQMYVNPAKQSLGGTWGGTFWSSSNYAYGNVWYQRFSDGNQNYTDKATALVVRPIRQF